MSLLARWASADDHVQVAEPGTVIENPFTAGAEREEPQATTQPRRDIVYQNPFATLSTAPPIEVPLLPGPVSRWRRTIDPLDESSPVKSAILSVDPIEYPLRAWDELPPAESLRGRVADLPATNAGRVHAAADELVEPLAQPEWLLVESPVVRSLPPLNQVSFDEPAWANEPLATANDVPLLNRPDADLLPLTVSNYVDSPEGWLGRAQQVARGGQSFDELSAVIELCKHGLRSEPPADIAASLRRLAAWAHNRRGELLADDGQPDAAADFQAAITLDPNCSLAIHNRAVTLAQQNQLDAALRDFNRVIELNPGLGIAYRNRAELLTALGRVGEAVADYNQAIAALPAEAELLAARGHAWQRLRDFSRAKTDLDQALQLAPDNPTFLTQRGNLSAEQGKFDDAVADFRRAVAIDPNFAEAHRSLAWLHATCPVERYRDAEHALSAVQQALAIAPADDYLMLDTLAAVHAARGSFGEAMAAQTQAIAAAPSHLAAPLQQRLALYKQSRPYIVSLPGGGVRRTSAESTVPPGQSPRPSR